MWIALQSRTSHGQAKLGREGTNIVTIFASQSLTSLLEEYNNKANFAINFARWARLMKIDRFFKLRVTVTKRVWFRVEGLRKLLETSHVTD